MPRLLTPALRAVDRLRTSARLAVLVVLMLVPTALAVTGFVNGANHDVAFTAAEREGVRVVEPALEAMAALVAGEPADLTGVADAVAEHPALSLDDSLAAVQAAAADGASTPAARLAVAQELAALVTAAGDSSNLILDPDLDSFYVMDMLVVQTPRLLVAALAQTADPAATLADRAVLAGLVSGAADALAADVDTACSATADPTLCDALGGVTEVSTAALALRDRMLADLTAPSGADPTDTAVAVAGTTAGTADALDALLATREAGYASQRLLMLVATAVFVVLAAWFAAAVWWRTRHDVALTLQAVTAIAAGDLTEHELPANADEMGDIGRVIASARGQMAENRDALAAAQTERSQQMHSAFLHQRAAERQSRERAQDLVAETSTTVVTQLDGVVQQVSAVHDAAQLIEQRVAGSTRATADVVSRAGHADSVVAALTESLRSVAGFVQVITGVADQTKLLALNATIEAARAGEAGRGFAIVAGEVKELAAETARSTAQITEIITALEQDAGAVSTAIVAMSQGIGGVDAAAAELSMVAEQQYALVGGLNASLGETIGRIRSMSDLADKLERRKFERVPTIGLTASVEAGSRSVPAEVGDLSEGGCRVLGPDLRPAGVGETVRVTLELPSGPIRVDAAVVESRALQAGVVQLRLRFVGLAGAAAGAVRAEIERRLASAV